MDKVEHLYIHIPFCNHICWYCDFKRQVCKNEQVKKQYIDKLICQLHSEFQEHKFKSIYIGGGTPNSLGDIIYPLLKELSSHLQDKYEFTIECNPEFVTNDQLVNFKTFKVNRISLGVQSTNDKILKQMGRNHKTNDVIQTIKLLRKNNFNNFSIDLIYGFNEQTLDDIQHDINFINQYKIPHVSWYCLEIKEGSIFNKMNYKLDEYKTEDMLELIVNKLKSLNYERYEVSSWAINKDYESIHNLAYWNTKDWISMGYGAFGLENMDYYENKGSIDNFHKVSHKLTLEEYYQQIWIMGLRTKYGLDLTNPIHKQAYEYYQNKLDKKMLVISNNRVKAKNLNTIDSILINII